MADHDGPVLIDVTLAISPDVPHWPGSTARCASGRPDSTATRSPTPAGGHCPHQGTHVDAPPRFIPGGGAGIEDVPLAVLCGPLHVVGIDYLSVECFGATDFPAHHTLLDAGIPIIEGLDLAAAEPGRYELTCLPIRLAGAEAARIVRTR